MTQFITLAGRKQVGKDTSAQMIRSLLTDHAIGDQDVSLGSPGATSALCMNAKIHVVHFADALKKACSIIFGIPLEDMETEGGKQKLTHVEWPVDFQGAYEGMGGPHDYSIWVAYNDPLCQRENHRGINPTPMTVREILQFVGTELFRNQLRADVWVESVFRQPYQEDDIVIIADCRFPNEAAFGRKHGLLIKIERATGLGGDGHASETSLDDYTDYHYVVQNNGSFDDLRMHLEAILVQRRFIINA